MNREKNGSMKKMKNKQMKEVKEIANRDGHTYNRVEAHKA